LQILRWIIAGVTCAAFTWSFLLIGSSRPDLLPYLVGVTAACLLTELLLKLWSERKQRRTAARENEADGVRRRHVGRGSLWHGGKNRAPRPKRAETGL